MFYGLLGKACANWFMGRFSITKTMIAFTLLGTLDLILTFTIHTPAVIWGAVLASFFFGPVYPTIYSHGLDQIKEKQHTETGGALMVMSLVGGAILPAIMGLVSDLSSSMQFAFIVPTIGFFLVALFFWTEHKHENLHPEDIQEH